MIAAKRVPDHRTIAEDADAERVMSQEADGVPAGEDANPEGVADRPE
jgi:hypothetical protein